MSKDGASNQGDSVDPPIKKRRGRQPRTSLLTANLQDAIASFTSVISKPVIQPGGFRDFTGWLHSIASTQYREAWVKLSEVFVRESHAISGHDIPQLKVDVCTEIVKRVVKREPQESSKLVGTNARRQSAIPSTGITVRTLLESYLQKTSRASSSGKAQADLKHSSMMGGSGSGSGSANANRNRGHRENQASRKISPTSSTGHHSTPRGSQSVGRSGSSGMDISDLLSQDANDPRRSTSGSNLPPLSTFVEQIRARRENEKSGRRH